MGKRLFAAIKIQPDVRFLQHLKQLQNHLLRDHIKWVDPSNIHVTLKFFGDTPEENIPAICEALEKACTDFGAYDASLSQLGIFGSRHQPRVIWVSLEPAATFKGLEQRITDALLPLGYQRDRQNFVPHLTLGRINKIADLKGFQSALDTYRDNLKLNYKATSVILYESILQRSGPEYIRIAEFLL